MSDFSVKRPVTTVMIILIVVILGAMSLMNLKQALMPEINMNIAIVLSSYDGAGPEEVESMVTKPLESALATVSNLNNIMTTSSSGSSLLMLTFEDGTDMDSAALKMRENIDLVKRFLPSGVEPRVMQIDPNMMDNLSIGVTGPMDLVELKNLLDNGVTSRLEKLDGVASVSESGGREREISIELQPDRMSSYGVDASQIMALLNAENRNLPGGNIIQGDTELQIRTTGEFGSLADIEDLIVGNVRGAMITLKDIATVTETFKKTTSYALVDGDPGVVLSVAKQSTANTVEVSDRVHAELVALRKDYPQLSFTVVLDTARFVKSSISNVWVAVFQSTVLAVLVLFVFLGDVRSSFIIGVAIPISIIATLGVMYFAGMTLNMVTLMALVISVGMLVDNSIVVLENIMRHLSMGKSGAQAALDGSREIMTSISASTLTTVIVFVPILFTGGLAGEMFQQLGLVIGISLGSSLVVSLTFVPMASSRLLKPSDDVYSSTRSSLWQKWSAQLGKLETGYRTLLAWSLDHKSAVVLVTLVFVVATGSIFSMLGMNMIPQLDMSSVSVSVTLPRGSTIEETGAAAETVLSRISDHPAIQDITLSVGGGLAVLQGAQTHSASLYVNLYPKGERVPATQVVDELIERIGLIPGVEVVVSSSTEEGGALGMDSGLTLQLYGEDMDVLRQNAEGIMERISVLPSLRNLESSLQEGVPQVNVRVDRQKASFYGLQSANIASAVQMAINGTTVSQYKQDGSEIDIVIRYDPDSMQYLTDLQNMVFTSPTGARVALHEIAEISQDQGPAAITKEDSRRYINVTGEIVGSDLNTVNNQVTALLADYPFAEGYSYEVGGTYTTMMESFQDLGIALLLGFVMLYMVIASQFESLVYPFIIIFSIPVAMTAGLFGLFLAGETFNVLAFIGLILLMGIVVNNGIVLVDFIHIQLEEGKSVREAILDAGPTRLRPILMTTITTVLGLMPMLLATGEGSELQTPLGAIISSGLTLSTLVTLLLIPVLYEMIYRLRHRKNTNRTPGAALDDNSQGNEVPLS